MPKNYSMIVVLRVGLVLIDGGLLLKMWVRASNLLTGYPKTSTHGGIGRRSGLKILCPLGTSEFDPR